MDFGVRLLELVKAVRVAVASSTHIGAAAFVMGRTEQEDCIVWELHAH